MLLSLTN
jgi:hypothetical protein